MTHSRYPELSEHAFFAGLDNAAVAAIQSCARDCHYATGNWIARQGAPADDLYFIQDGRVAVVFPAPQRELTIQTLSAGDIVGWSWLMPPHEWQFDIKAVKDCSMMGIDGRSLRAKCEQDHHLGYALMKRLSRVMVDRLQATRLQLMDVYENRK